MLVDESRLCDLSVINGAVIPCWSTLTAEDRSQLALSSWAGHTVAKAKLKALMKRSHGILSVLRTCESYLYCLWDLWSGPPFFRTYETTFQSHNTLCSYLCVLKLKGDRIPSLVDEPRLCDLSVIIGPVIPLLVSLRPQRIVLSLLWAAGKAYLLCSVVRSKFWGILEGKPCR
ncbi:hypothetical protein Godav_011289 [Gossypium davidsonii]|uniref:Uncharacterized protein n=1 Tax=Gossypium davidsonii TaxID=34287 RepID=A0A7J8RA71_GOSDV|nr:hypothetical protein [Gossypium davidsonii]